MPLDSALHLAITQRFIDERPIEVVFTRVTKVADGQGGFTKTRVSLPEQTVRKVGQGRQGATVARTTEDGSQVFPQAVLIAMPDADIQRYDKFVLDGITHEVVYTSKLPEWRLQAEIVENLGDG